MWIQITHLVYIGPHKVTSAISFFTFSKIVLSKYKHISNVVSIHIFKCHRKVKIPVFYKVKMQRHSITSNPIKSL